MRQLLQKAAFITNCDSTKDIAITDLQHEGDHWRHKAHKNPTDKNWKTYRDQRNEIKKVITEKSLGFKEIIYHQKITKKFGQVLRCILYNT